MCCAAVWNIAAHLQPKAQTRKGPHTVEDIMPGPSTQEGVQEKIPAGVH